MTQLYATIFALTLCAMLVGYGINSGRYAFAAFFACMTIYNAISIVGAAT